MTAATLARRKKAGAHSAPRPERRPGRAAGQPKPPPVPARKPAPRAVEARRRGRRRLVVIVALVAVGALTAVALVVAHTGLFSARRITVIGAVHTPKREILAASGLSSHPPLIDINTLAAAHDIERLPWIATARVSVSFPDSVRIVVKERVPIAYLPAGRGTAALVDTARHVVADVSAPGSLLALSGLGRPPAPGGELSPRATALLAVAAAAPASLVGRIVAVGFQSGVGVVLDLHGGTRAIVGTTTDLAEKFVALDTVLSGVALGGISSIDLRAPANPVLTP